MAYEPTNWQAGDIVTSAKLNKMEQGIAASGGIRVVHLTGNEDDHSLQLDITPNELANAFENEKIVVIMGQIGSSGLQTFISNFSYDGTTYVVISNNLPNLTSSDSDEYFTYDPNSDDSGNSGTDR